LKAGCRREYFDEIEIKWQEAGKNCTLRSFITSTLHQV
jgi:hypothetical protein